MNFTNPAKNETMEAIDLAKTQMRQHLAVAEGHLWAALESIKPLMSADKNECTANEINEIVELLRALFGAVEPKSTFQ